MGIPQLEMNFSRQSSKIWNNPWGWGHRAEWDESCPLQKNVKFELIIAPQCLVLYPFNYNQPISHIQSDFMIRKLEDYLWRVTKEFEPFLLLIFYHREEQGIRFKILQIQKELPKRCFVKDLNFHEMPDLIKYNFQNLGEIFQEIRITSKDCFHFENSIQMLRISLQIGSKLKQCVFQLEEREYTYTQSVELLLCQTEKEIERAEQPQQIYFRELQQLRAVNQHHTKEISYLCSVLERERVERQSMNQRFEVMLNELRTQIYQMKMNFMEEEESIPRHNTQRGQISSLICQEKKANINFITIQDEEQYWRPIQMLNNTIPRLNQCIFKLDLNAGKDRTNSFLRTGQRITLRNNNEGHKQYTSLVCLPPIALVSFKLISTREHNIRVGVIQYDRVNKPSTRREEKAISYRLRGNQLWEDGFRVQAMNKIERVNVGEVLTLFINGKEGHKKMQWWKSGKMMLQRSIPPGFENKQVYPFVNMIHGGDSIEFV